jgi:hypothetical protein
VKRFRFVPARTRAQVTARAPGHDLSLDASSIEGSFELDDAESTLLSAVAKCRLARLDAHDALKNFEVRRFLSLDEDPVAEGALLGPISLSRDAGGRLSGHGRLRFTLRGRTMETALSVLGTPPAVKATFELTFSGLGLAPPKLLFIKVKNELPVELDAQVELSPSSGLS